MGKLSKQHRKDLPFYLKRRGRLFKSQIFNDSRSDLSLLKIDRKFSCVNLTLGNIITSKNRADIYIYIYDL